MVKIKIPISSSKKKHVIWGWMQVGEVHEVDSCDRSRLEWAGYHPHLNRMAEKGNTVYIARDVLKISGMDVKVKGAGVFKKYDERLLLSDKDSTRTSTWKFPRYFYPKSSENAMSYHSDLKRWTIKEDCVLLNSCARGQEFVLDTQYCLEALRWLGEIIKGKDIA